MKKKILICLSFIMLLSLIAGTVDYIRIKSDNMPIFMIRISDPKKYNPDGYKDVYFGLGYKMERETSVSVTQPLSQSSSLRFGLWFYTWEIDVWE